MSLGIPTIKILGLTTEAESSEKVEQILINIEN